MKIVCVRHGEAESPGVNSERPLTRQGHEDVRRTAGYLAQVGLHVAHILHSPKRRAQETAILFSEALSHASVTECPSLLDEGVSPAPLVEMVSDWTDDTMLVGHLPFLPQFVNALVLGDALAYPIVNFPPGGVVCLDRVESDRWIIQWALQAHLISR